MNIVQEQYTSEKGNKYVFQSPASNIKTLEILDRLEVAGGGSPVMHKAFPMVLKEVVVVPQGLTVDSEQFHGAGGVTELIEVCSQAVRFLSGKDAEGVEVAGEVSEPSDHEEGTTAVK